MKIRIKFQKYDRMKFIGHLDMMRYFQKCMRLADVDMAYSSGYSPHMIMSFAAPLGVGITSDSEYLDIEVKHREPSLKAVKKLNEVMVEGVKVISYRQLEEGVKNAMSCVAAASYTVYVKEEYEDPFKDLDLTKKLQEFFEEQTEIIVTKPTKKGEKQIDLKQLIYELRTADLQKEQLLKYQTEEITKKTSTFYFTASSGSTNNIKPELLIQTFCDFCQIPFEKKIYQVHRNEIYGQTEQGEFQPLESYGIEII